MIRLILGDIAKELSKIEYTTIVGGRSFILNKGGDSYPVCQNVYRHGRDVKFEGDYLPMLPTLVDPSIMFFEAGTLSYDNDNRSKLFQLQTNLIVWYDSTRVKGHLSMALFDDITSDVQSNNALINIDVVSITEVDAIARYKLGSQQMLSMHPYRMFSISLFVHGQILSCDNQISIDGKCKKGC